MPPYTVFPALRGRKVQGVSATMGSMKLLYLFGAILACNILAVVVSARSTKTALAGVSAALAVYGALRLLG